MANSVEQNVAYSPAQEKSRCRDNAYKFLVQLSQDDQGIYSAVALNLPGTGSCGDTWAEAMENFREAAAGTIEYYVESGEEIPWEPIALSHTPEGAEWISIDA